MKFYQQTFHLFYLCMFLCADNQLTYAMLAFQARVTFLAFVKDPLRAIKYLINLLPCFAIKQAFFRDVSTTSAPLTTLKQNGCYCGREGFLCAGITGDELRYSCTASFQKTIWQTFSYKTVYLRLDQEFSRNWLFMQR